MKVLIIDDEPIIRRSLQRAFVSQGHETVTASDGISGVDVWKKFNPEIVLLDIVMPGLNGYQVLETIGNAKCKVILMSAFSSKVADNLDKKRGYDLFLEKPFQDIFEVVEKAQELVNGQS